MQGDFGLSLTQDGYLPAAFLVRSSASMHLFLSLHVSACASRIKLLHHEHRTAAIAPEPGIAEHPYNVPSALRQDVTHTHWAYILHQVYSGYYEGVKRA